MNEINEKDHIGLIYKVAKYLIKNSVLCVNKFGTDISEYLGEGYLALSIAKEKYDPNLGTKFSTYAMNVIYKRLIKAALDSSLIKVGSQARYDAWKASRNNENKTDRIKKAINTIAGNITSIETDLEDTKVLDQNWELLEYIEDKLKILDERTRNVIIMRYGLNGNEPMTLEQVGSKLTPPVTRERVRQIEFNGINQLKLNLNKP